MWKSLQTFSDETTSGESHDLVPLSSSAMVSDPTTLEIHANEASASVAIKSANCSQLLTALPPGRRAPLFASSAFLQFRQTAYNTALAA